MTLHAIEVTNHTLKSITFTCDDVSRLKEQVADYIGENILFSEYIEPNRLDNYIKSLAVIEDYPIDEWTQTIDANLDDVMLSYSLRG